MRSRVIAAAVLAAITTASTASSAVAHTPGRTAPSIGQQLAVPAYFYPADDGAVYWEQLNAASDAARIAVANPASGPNNLVDPNYTAAIQSAHDAGITVLGYVDIGYFGTTGHRTRLNSTDPDAWLAQAEQDINAWFQLYGDAGIGGIFIDQVTSWCGDRNALADRVTLLTLHTKEIQPQAVVVTNQGIDMDECYRDTADILLAFEGTYVTYQDWRPRDWMREEDPDKFWHLVYGTPSSDEMAAAVALSKERNAGYVYVTPDVLANPWDTLPAGDYWERELAALAPGRPDHIRPTPPYLRRPVHVSSTSITLEWIRSVDPAGLVVGYEVYDGDIRVATAPGSRTSATVANLKPNTAHTFTVRARDATRNASMPIRARTVSTRPADSRPPTPVGGPHATDVGLSSATLAWEPAVDPDGSIAGYLVYQDGVKILTLPATTLTVPVGWLRPASSYVFTVVAQDQTGNVSPPSAPVAITTPDPSAVPIVDYSATVDQENATYIATFALPFNFHRVFIDIDNDTSTGFTVLGGALGADFLIENSFLYSHLGGNGWNWAFVPVDPLVSITGGTYTWQVPVSVYGPDLTGPHRIVFNGSGTSPEAYSDIIHGQLKPR